MIFYKIIANPAVSYVLGDIENLDVDIIVSFVQEKDIQNIQPMVNLSFKKSMHNFLSVDINRVENHKYKYIMYTNDLVYKPDSFGYNEALRSKLDSCLKKAPQNYCETLALPIIQQENIQTNIVRAYFECFSKNTIRPLKNVYLVCNNPNIFDIIKRDFSSKVTEYEIPKSNSKTANASGRREIEASPKDTVTSDTTDLNYNCPICLCDITDRKTLDKCGHTFCSDCIDQSFTQSGRFCPICQTIYGQIIGLQPPGIMTVEERSESLPGFGYCGMYVLVYKIPHGIQQKDHPNPGIQFSGTHRTAYLPANKEGTTVLKMLQKAFQQKLIFTVGFSRTTNCDNTVTWNDIHHKTSTCGGALSFGYPDPDYLKRVTLELEAKGVDAKSVEHETIHYKLESR